MKELWPNIAIHDYSGELGSLAIQLKRPVLQDLANVICLSAKNDYDWMSTLQHVSRLVLQSGPMHSIRQEETEGDSFNTDMVNQVFLYTVYAVQLVIEVRKLFEYLNYAKPELKLFTVDELKSFYHSEDLDDLARVVGRMFGFITTDIARPWLSITVPSKVDIQTKKAIEFWI